ncbi:MAG TPA: 3'-5' exonuclease, partial [Actinomycetota bacterium]|nr:3'-5' exonuclease [Actinomycetota bacterium]
PRDELAWFRILHYLDGVGPATARRITAVLVGAPGPLVALTSLAAPEEVLGADAAELAAAVRDAGQLGADRAGPAVERVRAWLEPRLEQRYAGVEARIADLEQLNLAADQSATLQQFLTDLTLDPPSSTSDLAGPPHLDEDFVTISTIHSAKGCEWDVVHVIHLADGNVPSDLATGDAEAIEEERRLLYVAMTRAKNHLYAYLPLRYHHRPALSGGWHEDRHDYAQLTRFFTAAVLACLDEVTTVGPVAAPTPVDHTVNTAALERLDRAVAALWD